MAEKNKGLTEEELKDTMTQNEISDDELDEVAGGATMPGSTTVSGGAVISIHQLEKDKRKLGRIPC